MANNLGFTQAGLDLALDIKKSYREREAVCMPGGSRILMPEHLLNRQIHLEAFEDPLPLAVVATRDPDGPMSIAAATRLSPLGGEKKLISGVFQLVGETTRHGEVRKCVDLIKEHDFNPDLIQKLHKHAATYGTAARRQYTAALKENLRALMDGDMEPRVFVAEFFELTEAGNLRNEVRRKLVSSLLTSPTVRPAIKFLFLENFSRLPKSIRFSVIADLVSAPNTPHMQSVKEELRWMFGQDGREAVVN